MESLAEVRRTLVKVHQGAIEGLDFIWRGISVLLLILLRRWRRTVTTLLHYELVLEQGSKVASEEGLHVHPNASGPPDHQQATLSRHC